MEDRDSSGSVVSWELPATRSRRACGDAQTRPPAVSFNGSSSKLPQAEFVCGLCSLGLLPGSPPPLSDSPPRPNWLLLSVAVVRIRHITRFWAGGRDPLRRALAPQLSLTSSGDLPTSYSR
jgi:hypothetical protein